MSVRIIIENGELKIKGTAAEKKAWNTVQANLLDLQKHAGGNIAEDAKVTAEQFADFYGILGSVCEWAAERKPPAPATA